MASILSSILPTSSNTTSHLLTPSTLHPPIYPILNPSLLPFISDKSLNILTPILCYWIPSLFFHLLDISKIPYFEKRRIHDSEEMLQRNKASVLQVIGAVVLQHAVQVALAVVALEGDEEIQRKEVMIDHLGAMGRYAQVLGSLGDLLLGAKAAQGLARLMGGRAAEWVYWYGIPAFQLVFAFFIMDTWQYFLHRLFHTVPFLYRHFHSVHHRLYVPYAFGALYNHPLEGILFDSSGALVSHFLSGMTIRQATVLFGVSSIKTVDDHCGYKIWWDPCQAIFGNNAEYHDLHHQSWGIKKNFSQPFFTNWDKLLGTHLSKSEGQKIYARRRAASASKSHPVPLDTHNQPISIDPLPETLNATLPLYPLPQIQDGLGVDLGFETEGGSNTGSGSGSGSGSDVSTPTEEREERDSGVEVSDDGEEAKGKSTALGEREGMGTRARVRMARN